MHYYTHSQYRTPESSSLPHLAPDVNDPLDRYSKPIIANRIGYCAHISLAWLICGENSPSASRALNVMNQSL